MSWIQKLYETYENCRSEIGNIASEKEVPLLPICHTTQKAQIEVVIDLAGNFKSAKILSKDEARTIIPCTESSGGRAGKKPECHPLCDKLQYIAKDFVQFGGMVTSGYTNNPYEPFNNYFNLLLRWCDSKFSHPKSCAVLNYIIKGDVIKNLVENKILLVNSEGKLIEKQDKKKNKLALEGIQYDAFVRWVVWSSGDQCPKAYEDKTLWESWIKFYSNLKYQKTLCYVTGIEQFAAEQHPAKIRNDGDKAKLISSNDWSGFTFRGRFIDTKEQNNYQTCGVGFEVTQKAHSALRWLINRQGYKRGDQAIVAWATSGKELPDPLADPFTIFGIDKVQNEHETMAFTAQEFALKLKNKISGYYSQIGSAAHVVIMGLDSATPGRMAITYYREIECFDFLNRLNKWHYECSWVHSYRYVENSDKRKKRFYVKFVGAPAPNDIAESAYGGKIDDKLRKSMIEKILPCIIDGQKIPRDIVESVIRRAVNRIVLENWEWNKLLSIACALYRKYKIDYEKEEVEMSLDEKRTSRDYLYGRLLALADSIEQWALDKSKEDRQTNANRLMQRFAEHPFSTWRTIELALKPYEARLGGMSKKRRNLISEVMAMFELDDFNSDKKLSGEFLIGYHCQIEALKLKKAENVQEQFEA